MRQSDWEAVLEAATPAMLEHLRSLPTRRVYPHTADAADIRADVDARLPADPRPPESVITELAEDLAPYVTAHASGRFFGFVIGGLHPASWGAELLVSTWDQNAGLHAPTPGSAVVEDIAAEWLLELLDLPRDSSVGFVTGGQMATFTCLAAARHAVLREAGWDVEADGLPGAPPVTVVLKRGVHSTVPRALRYLGLGAAAGIRVACDGEDRMDPGDLAETLTAVEGPTIVCVESGNVNTGSFDDFAAVADLTAAHRQRGNPTWVHVDGAVGLLARAADGLRPLTAGLERLDSWSTDGHKLLNTAYDSGIAICRDAASHRAAMSVQASYLEQGGGARDPMDYNPEFSRRARGVGVYATLRALGRSGVAEIVRRTHRLAHRFAGRLADSGRAEIVNDVVFNQVLVRWLAEDGDNAALADRVMAGVREEGTAFFSGTTYRGERLMRISVSDWATDADDVDRVVDALLRHAGGTAGESSPTT